MRVAGLCFAPFGPPLEQLYMRDSWTPEFLISVDVGRFRFGIEDVLLAFAVGAIGTGITEAAHSRREARHLPEVTPAAVCLVLLSGVAALTGTLLLTHAGMHSMHAQACSFAAIWLTVVMLFRPRWIASALAAACAMAALMGIFYAVYYLRLFPDIIDRWWMKDRYMGIFIGPLPIEEFLWAGVSALYVGSSVRFCVEAVARRESAAERR